MGKESKEFRRTKDLVLKNLERNRGRTLKPRQSAKDRRSRLTPQSSA
ncbi:MAG: hypothetical protein U5L08_02225 [Xanthomonadales bacterium]|nr:hypothetical protein [Xanthomonadales bacterium]